MLGLKPEFVEAILDSIADGVFCVDQDFRITFWNRAAEKITGFAHDEAIGRFCHDVFQTNVCQSACLLRRTLQTDEDQIDRPINILTKNGDEKPVSISTAVLRDGNGAVIGGAETFRDLSALEELRKHLKKQYSFQDIISKNHKILEIFSVMPDIAESRSTVLIQGPSGSGKELFARAIHNLSPRKEKHFVAVNCAALPDTLLESELFGYKAGAFTDARRDKPGRFDMAQGGTIFLDEIGDISAALQAKLLRVLEEKVFEPLGATEPRKADVRIISATNKDLSQLMAGGSFRDDLYYRLNVVRVDLPALKDRREDIPLLAEHFISRFNALKGREIKGIAPRAMAALLNHGFPGNVRELENIVERAFVLCKHNVIEVSCLPPEVLPQASAQPSLEDTGAGPLENAEADAIRRALAVNGGHRQRTADTLGIHKTTLIRKMKKLGIKHP